MQFTRKGDYALKAMTYLTQAGNAAPHTIDEISHNSNIPRHFLAKILKDLTRAQLLVAVKGARGGYNLARRASDINLLEIMEVGAGPMSMEACMAGKERCPDTQTCALYPVWQKASNSIVGLLKSTRLSSLRQAR